MVDRTLAGNDRWGMKFQAYSDSYVDSLAFARARKDPSKVNLRLTNQMLSSVRLIDDQDGELLIGIDDMTQVAKAYNHLTGDTLPKREFLGIAAEEVSEILAEFPLPKDAEAFEAFADDFVLTAERYGEELKISEIKEVYQDLSELSDVNDYISKQTLLRYFKSTKKMFKYLEAMQLVGKVFMVGDYEYFQGIYVL